MVAVIRVAHIPCRKQLVSNAVLLRHALHNISGGQLLTTSMHVRMQLAPAGLPALRELLLLVRRKPLYTIYFLLQL